MYFSTSSITQFSSAELGKKKLVATLRACMLCVDRKRPRYNYHPYATLEQKKRGQQKLGDLLLDIIYLAMSDIIKKV